MQKRGVSILVVLWLLSGIFLIMSMVFIGGITRLTGSGLSITEWNLISGTLPPLTDAEWLMMFEKYKQFPEYQKLNFGMTLDGFKNIFWWEFLHRLLGRFTGLVFIVPFLIFLLTKRLAPWLIKRLLFILALGIAQGLMGWIMVMSGLNDIPHVSHYRLAAHLSLALLLIGLILWTMADLLAPVEKRRVDLLPFNRLSWLLTGVILLQIVLGAFVAGLKSGFSYNTWPLMEGELIPSQLAADITWQNILSNGPAVQFLHRWFAIVVLAGIFLFWINIKKKKLPHTLKTTVWLLLFVTFLQVALGVATLVLAVPIALGVLHQIVAVFLFMLAVLVTHQLHQRTGIAEPVASRKAVAALPHEVTRSL